MSRGPTNLASVKMQTISDRFRVGGEARYFFAESRFETHSVHPECTGWATGRDELFGGRKLNKRLWILSSEQRTHEAAHEKQQRVLPVPILALVVLQATIAICPVSQAMKGTRESDYSSLVATWPPKWDWP